MQATTVVRKKQILINIKARTMKKFLVITLLAIAAIIIAVLTFVVKAIGFIFGLVGIGITLVLLIILWIAWKIND